eukprot:3524685-Amphidinium_carterae.1
MSSRLAPSISLAMEGSILQGLSDGEKLTPDKLLRGAMRQWSQLVRELERSTADDVAPVLIQAIALLTAGLTELCNTEDMARAFLSGVTRCISSWLYPASEFDVDTTIPDVVYSVAHDVSQSCMALLEQLGTTRVLLGSAVRPIEDDATEGVDVRATLADIELLYGLVQQVVLDGPAEDDVKVWLSNPWPEFILWAAHQKRRVDSLGVVAVKHFAPLKAIAQQGSGVLGELVASLESGSATVGCADSKTHPSSCHVVV